MHKRSNVQKSHNHWSLFTFPSPPFYFKCQCICTFKISFTLTKNFQYSTCTIYYMNNNNNIQEQKKKCFAEKTGHYIFLQDGLLSQGSTLDVIIIVRSVPWGYKRGASNVAWNHENVCPVLFCWLLILSLLYDINSAFHDLKEARIPLLQGKYKETLQVF